MRAYMTNEYKQNLIGNTLYPATAAKKNTMV